MSALDGFVAAVLREADARRRRLEALRAAVLLDFEPDPSARCRRSDVHASAAARLRSGVSAAFVAELRRALSGLDGVREATVRGRRFYVGLKPRPERAPTKRANAGVSQSDRHVANARAARGDKWKRVARGPDGRFTGPAT